MTAITVAAVVKNTIPSQTDAPANSTHQTEASAKAVSIIRAREKSKVIFIVLLPAALYGNLIARAEKKSKLAQTGAA